MRERPNTERTKEGARIINFWRERTPEEKHWDRDYADECDKFAKLEAEKTGKKRWGRWWLSRSALNTHICHPNIGSDGYFKQATYDIDLPRIAEDWLGHMIFTKDWVGERGLYDLAQALRALRKEQAG